MRVLRLFWKPVAAAFALLLLWARLRAGRRAAEALAQQSAYRDTREAMDAVEDLGDDPALARRWLQSRDPAAR